MLTEYGGPWEEAWEGGSLKSSFEQDQVTWHANNWGEIVGNSYKGNGEGNSIGGIVVHWLDRWWEHGDWCTQDEGDNGGLKDNDAVCIACHSRATVSLVNSALATHNDSAGTIYITNGTTVTDWMYDDA